MKITGKDYLKTNKGLTSRQEKAIINHLPVLNDWGLMIELLRRIIKTGMTEEQVEAVKGDLLAAILHNYSPELMGIAKNVLGEIDLEETKGRKME